MAEESDLGALTVVREGEHLRFSFVTSSETMLELPPDFEANLRQKLSAVLPNEASFVATMDLEGRAAISSRQLGALLALQKVLRARGGRLRLAGVSEAIRELLETTRTGRFFDME